MKQLQFLHFVTGSCVLAVEKLCMYKFEYNYPLYNLYSYMLYTGNTQCYGIPGLTKLNMHKDVDTKCGHHMIL